MEIVFDDRLLLSGESRQWTDTPLTPSNSEVGTTSATPNRKTSTSYPAADSVSAANKVLECSVQKAWNNATLGRIDAVSVLAAQVLVGRALIL